jgi:protein-S-isoprenylcysteine O-methyltransferase Ste14
MNKLGILTAFLLILFVVPAVAQETVPMADQLRSEGKIYVVVIMILIVLAGLILYLFLMDRKVKKLEKLVSEKKKQTN